MAYLQKVKLQSGSNAWQLHYYFNGRRHCKYFPAGAPQGIARAEKKRIEAELIMHKLGLKKFEPESETPGLTLHQFNGRITIARQHDVSPKTLKRNAYALKRLIQCLGENTLIDQLTAERLDEFKNYVHSQAITAYKTKHRPTDEQKIKRGINKELSNLRTIFRAAAAKGIISEAQVPKIKLIRTDRFRLPAVLNNVEIIDIANQLTNQARLAFWIIRYTGCRRGEILRENLNDNKGLKWCDVDWMRNTIKLYGKGKEKLVPMHDKLREILLAAKPKNAVPEEHIIKFVADTITQKFREAIVKAGINKAGAVHILRHTAASQMLSAGNSIRDVMELLGHEDLQTTQIYLHTQKENLRKAVNNSF